MSDDAQRLVVLGFDAGVPELIVRWAGEGRLPTLARLMRNGASARLSGEQTVSEHGFWAAVLSGLPLGEIGKCGYREILPGTYDLRPVQPLSAGPFFWNGPARSGRRTVLLDVPSMVPDPSSAAVHVNWGPHGPEMPEGSHPEGLLSELEAKVPRLPIERDHIESDDSASDRRAFEELRDSVGVRGELVRLLIERERPDLLVAGFTEVHTAAHRLWRHHRGQPGSDPGLADALREIYQATDRELGRVIDALPADAAVVVLAGVGVDDRQDVDPLTFGFCDALGYRVRATGGRRPIDVARKLVPERLRALLARRLSTDAQEGLMLDDLGQGTDWSGTRLYPIPDPDRTQLRVNLRGREPQGIVERGNEYEELLERASEDLRALQDPDSGEPLITRVVRLRALDGNPPLRTPDLVASWRPHVRFIERAVHPRGELSQSTPGWARFSGHGAACLLVACGPGIRAGLQLGEVDSLGVGPTLLALAGAPPDGSLPGDVLEQLLEPAPKR